MNVSSVISAENLSKRFEQVIALDGFSLSANKGIVGLIGPNGAGKTTFLRILLGLIEADEGQVQVLGFDSVQDSYEIRQRVGVLHEHQIYPSSMSVNQFLERVSKLYTNRNSPKELLDLVGLTDAAQRKIGNLSAGMRQRLGIAQALIGRPELVFLDEPTSNLDVMARRDLLKTLVRVHEDEGVSFCIISHVLSELERVCSDVAFIKAGRVIVVGPLHEVVTKFAASLYQIVVSDPHLIYDELANIDGVERVEIAGVKTITMALRDGKLDSIMIAIEQLAKQKGVRIYEIEKANTLEEAFLEVMRNE
ncbi:MAG: ABC transporter ATP-binding protein [Candidatus Thorarchaeota archaeon]